jgi:hypothetical protein
MCDKDVENWNYTDAVILPNAVKTPLKGQEIASYCIANKEGQTAYVYCLTTHENDKETILVPQWVINKLSLNTSKVVLKTCKLEHATKISMRIYNKGITNDELHKALTKYKHLQSNTIIPINIGGKEMHIKVEKTEPNKDFVMLYNSNVYIEFLEKEDKFIPFLGMKANTLGGETKSEGKKATDMAREAALRRFQSTAQ